MKKSVGAEIEELFYDNFLRFFQKAEERRRWDIDLDVPWAAANHESSDLTADIVQFFSAVEMYLPDYTGKMMQLIRESRGRAWFHLNWGYEESKHSLVLEEWLLRSGKRSDEQVQEFSYSLLDGREWELPFDHPRQMMIYTMIQELATGLNYINLRKRAREENDKALATLLGWVASDESAHYNFYRVGVKTYLEREPDETVADIKFVFQQFAMPAQALIPNFAETSKRIDAAGIYGPRQYLQKVRLPILANLGLTREQLRAAGTPSHLVDEIADRDEQAAMDVACAAVRRHFSLPVDPSSVLPRRGRIGLTRIE